MTKDVLVSVRGAHIADGETNNLEVIMAGSYYFKNGKHYIIYDERNVFAFNLKRTCVLN